MRILLKAHGLKKYKMPFKYPFIVFEGIEASGKSTQIQLLAEHLQKTDNDFILIREPGGTDIGERIRAILKDTSYLNKMTPETELLLMNAARAQLIREIISPALEQGKIVICDRYYYSSLAYQGYGRGIYISSLEQIINYSIGNLQPDIVFFMDIPLKISRQRIIKRNQQLQSKGIQVRDRFEEADMDFHQKVYSGYKTIFAQEDSRFKIINATEKTEVIAQNIWNILNG